MINIITLYRTVNEALAKDFGSGYTTAAEFNDKVDLAQSILMGYYINKYPKSVSGQIAIQPFVEENPYIGTIDGVVNDLPDDYIYDISASLYKWDNNCDTPNRILKKIVYNTTPENIDTYLIDAIKKKGSWYVLGSGVTFYNTDGLEVLFKYIRKYNTATYAVTIDGVSKQQNPDPNNSINLEWADALFDTFVNILLYFKGVELRDEGLLSYIQLNNLYEND